MPRRYLREECSRQGGQKGQRCRVGLRKNRVTKVARYIAGRGGLGEEGEQECELEADLRLCRSGFWILY